MFAPRAGSLRLRRAEFLVINQHRDRQQEAYRVGVDGDDQGGPRLDLVVHLWTCAATQWLD